MSIENQMFLITAGMVMMYGWLYFFTYKEGEMIFLKIFCVYIFLQTLLYWWFVFNSAVYYKSLCP